MLTPEREAYLRRHGQPFPATEAFAEIDALRAKIAALEAAGDGLAASVEKMRCIVDDPTRPMILQASENLARWREVTEG